MPLMAERNGFTFYVIEATPKGYGDKVKYYCSGKGYKWKDSPHEGTHYSMKRWAEKRIEREKKCCDKIRLLTYESKLEQEQTFDLHI